MPFGRCSRIARHSTQWFAEDRCSVSAIVAAEIRFGLERRRLPERRAVLVQNLLYVLPVEAHDEVACRVCGTLRLRLQQAGITVAAMDILIVPRIGFGAHIGVCHGSQCSCSKLRSNCIDGKSVNKKPALSALAVAAGHRRGLSIDGARCLEVPLLIFSNFFRTSRRLGHRPLAAAASEACELKFCFAT